VQAIVSYTTPNKAPHRESVERHDIKLYREAPVTFW